MRRFILLAMVAGMALTTLARPAVAATQTPYSSVLTLNEIDPGTVWYSDGVFHVRGEVSEGVLTDEQPTFGRPTILGIHGQIFYTEAEPTLRIDTQGRVYSSNSGADASLLWISTDEGKSFKWAPASAQKTGQLPTCDPSYGGDDEIATDSADRLYLVQAGVEYHGQRAIPVQAPSRSGDQGATFTFGCNAVTERLRDGENLDRPWYAVDGDPMNGGNIFLGIVLGDGDPACLGEIGGGRLAMARSPVPGKETEAGITFGPLERATGRCEGRGIGEVQVSPLSHHAFMLHLNAYQEDLSHTNEEIRLVRCEAVPFTKRAKSGLKCVDRLVSSMPGFQNGFIPSLAIDTAGNLYATWTGVPLNEFGSPAGDVSLYWSSSSDDGDTWSPAVQIPAPGQHNSIFAWAAAGDPGRVDVAWYGTDSVDQDFSTGCGGPGDVTGDWTLYFTQTLNGLDPVPTFTSPVAASEHFIHRGGIDWVPGTKFCVGEGAFFGGDAGIGDFFQMRVGADGEANIAYGDTNTTNNPGFAHLMFVRQNGGAGVFASNPIIDGDPAATNSVTDAAGDATYEADGSVGHSQANLDILGSSVSKLDPDHYRVTIDVADLTTLAPDPSTGNTDTSLDWLVQWFVPSSTDEDGGKNFFAYMESTDGGAPTFWDGEGAANVSPLNGAIIFTYPGNNQITGSYTPTAPGTITIDVPIADVTEVDPLGDTLFSVTASTTTLAEPANTFAPFACCDFTDPPFSYWAGGSPFNLIESAQAYDFVP